MRTAHYQLLRIAGCEPLNVMSQALSVFLSDLSLSRSTLYIFSVNPLPSSTTITSLDRTHKQTCKTAYQKQEIRLFFYLLQFLASKIGFCVIFYFTFQSLLIKLLLVKAPTLTEILSVQKKPKRVSNVSPFGIRKFQQINYLFFTRKNFNASFQEKRFVSCWSEMTQWLKRLLCNRYICGSFP